MKDDDCGHTSEYEAPLSASTGHLSVWEQRPSGRQWSNNAVELYTSDALEMLKAMQDKVADLVFLDPPFNLGKRYGSRRPDQDRMPVDSYRQYLVDTMAESARILKPGGSMYLYHIPVWAMQLAPVLAEKLTFRHWIAISMKNGFARGDKLYPAHYALLYFTRGAPAAFQRPKIDPAKCRHCGKLVKDYGGYRKYIRNGLNLSDFWDDVSPVRHRKAKHRKANELPALIVDRALAISGVKNGVFVDPFMGAGTSVIAAKNAGMRAVAADIDESQLEIVVDRLTDGSTNEGTKE